MKLSIVRFSLGGAFASASLLSLTSAAVINTVNDIENDLLLHNVANADRSSIESMQNFEQKIDSSPFDNSQLGAQSMRGKSGKGGGRNRCLDIVEHRRKAQELETTGKKRECHTDDVWDLTDWFTANESGECSTTQGIRGPGTECFWPPFTDLSIATDPDLPSTAGPADYYGIWNRDAQDAEKCPYGRDFGTKVTGTVTVCDDTEVTIETRATNAMAFGQCVGDCFANWGPVDNLLQCFASGAPFCLGFGTNDGIIFGATPDQICNEGAEPGFGTFDLFLQFTKKPEEKLSDLGLRKVNGDPDYFPQIQYWDFKDSKDSNGNELDILQCSTAEAGDEDLTYFSEIVEVNGITCPQNNFPASC